MALTVAAVVAALLDRAGQPRDGATIIGGEPFFQAAGLLRLLRLLKARHVHTTIYTGYTLEALARRAEPEIRRVLGLVDLLVDGPYVAALADGAGEWRGSRNQRLIPRPEAVLAGRAPNRSARTSLSVAPAARRVARPAAVSRSKKRRGPAVSRRVRGAA